MAETLYAQLKAAGCQMDHHASDLYVLYTPEARAIIAAALPGFATMFKSQIDGKLWFDLPFMYEPWWASRLEHQPHPGAVGPGLVDAVNGKDMEITYKREEAHRFRDFYEAREAAHTCGLFGARVEERGTDGFFRVTVSGPTWEPQWYLGKPRAAT